MWSKKWYLKRNISWRCSSAEWIARNRCCLEVWDDAIVVSAGKLRKLWDSLSELHSSLSERRLEKTVLSPVLLPVKTVQFTQFFRQVWRHTVKSLSLTDSVRGALDCINMVLLIVHRIVFSRVTCYSYFLWCSMLLEPYIHLSWGLSEKKHLTNGDQWNEGHAVTQPDVFDKIYKFLPPKTVVAIVQGPYPLWQNLMFLTRSISFPPQRLLSRLYRDPTRCDTTWCFWQDL